MTRIVTAFAAAIGLITGCGNTSDEPRQAAPSKDPPAFVAGTDSWITTSAGTKRKYQISVAVPASYAASQESYPVLYATDANYHFGTLVETARLMKMEKLIPEIVIVGIGYPVGYGVNTVGPRAFDLTPTPDPAWVEAATRDFPKNGFDPPEGSGGGVAFLRFIREELVPSIEQKYRVQRDDRAYYGFSLGGLLGAYALFDDTKTFNRFILGSPALFWHNRFIFDHEKVYAQSHKSLPARVFLSVGLDEETEDDPGFASLLMVSNLRDFVKVLEGRRYQDFVLQTQYFQGERHNSVGGATISRGLRFIYR